MAARGRKSVSPWYTCDVCHVVLTHRDVELHQETSCPPDPDSYSHCFISNKVLYGFLEKFVVMDSLQFVPNGEHRHLVLLSVSTMQLCGMAIGDPVIVHHGSVPVVMTAWPTTDKNPFAVCMLRESIDLNWEQSEGLVKVHSLPGQPLLAQEVTLSYAGGTSMPSHAASLLQGHYNKKILCVGRRLSVLNYGQELHFQVKHVLSFSTDDTPCEPTCSEVGSVTKSLGRLSCVAEGEVISHVASECTEVPLFKVVAVTKWCILNDVAGKVGKPQRGRIALHDVGGLQMVIAELKELIDFSLGKLPSTAVQGLKVSHGVLLYGPAGTGKTLVAEAVAAESGAFVSRVQAPEVFSKFVGETEARLREQFEVALAHAPSIVLLDEVECLCPVSGGHGTEQERRVAATLLTLLDDLQQRAERVLVIATTSRPDDLHPALRRPGRFDQELEVGVPSPEARLDILCKLLHSVSHQLTADDIRAIASSTHGFVGADLASLCAHAGRFAMRVSHEVTREDFAAALTLVKPSAMRKVLVQVPDVRWSDIAGQQDLKLKLRQAVEWPLKHPQAFSRLGISAPRGILMFGPPGCSKTMIAKALATESRLNFLSIKGPELFSKWVGESERAVREVFRRARQVAPAIVFFDELDAIGGERAGVQSQGSNVQERVLAQLLTEMDGVEPLGNVVVVGATNRPDRIDKALLRPGRLDRVVYVPLPDKDTRREILELQLRRTAVTDDVDVEELVRCTDGYSGAEVVAVCNEAALKALEEDMLADRVHRSHFLAALTTVTPRTTQSLLQIYHDYQTV